MQTSETKRMEVINENDLKKYDKFYKLYCPTKREEVFHGVREENGFQFIKCLSCNYDEYIMHIDGRNKIETSLWESFIKYGYRYNLDSFPEKKLRKKRYNVLTKIYYLIFKEKQ